VQLSADQVDAKLSADQLDELRRRPAPGEDITTAFAEAERLRAEWNRPPF
jgi:hypothetical protein